jgi:penicillin-binding protein 1C
MQEEHRFSKEWFMKALKIAGVACCGGLVIFFCFVLYYAKTLPSFEEIASQPVTNSNSTRFYDRTGSILLYQTGQQRTVASFDEIPQSVKDATIAIEDQEFYTEPAFNWKGILRAAFVDLTHGAILQGGSTITQQVARNAFLSLDQTFSRKLKELILAIRLSQFYSKDQILDLYLNDVSYGPTLSGVQTASEAYFGIPAVQLDIAQSALLAAIPNAPTYYSPWGSHVSDLLTRQKLVLQRMYSSKKITKAQFNAALAEKITFQPESIGGIKAPHFVMAVQEYLVEKYGEDTVDKGSLKVITTLDWNLQQEAETAVSNGAAQNEKLYQGKNASLVAEDPKTGQILALVGSRNYFDIQNEGNFDVATQGLRQPGSSLKPFVYLEAFKEGYTPDTVLFDVPTEFSTDSSCPAVPNYKTTTNKSCFHPQDFEGTFAGPVSIRTALAESINVPAVKMLYLVGMNNVIDTTRTFGITTLTNPKAYGLSLVLGGGSVHLIDLTEAYSVLAADGTKHDQAMILSVQDGSGKTLESYSDKATQVYDPQDISLVNNVLSDANARSGLFQNSLGLTEFPGYDVALKTGTSNDYRDAWSMGYTPSLVVGVWAGNNNNSPMQQNGSSILAAVPIWHAFMAQALQAYQPETFPAPDPTNPSKPILAGNYTANNQIHTILYYINKNDPTGPAPSNPASDPQFSKWETGVLNWARQNIPNFTTEYNR